MADLTDAQLDAVLVSLRVQGYKIAILSSKGRLMEATHGETRAALRAALGPLLEEIEREANLAGRQYMNQVHRDLEKQVQIDKAAIMGFKP